MKKKYLILFFIFLFLLPLSCQKFSLDKEFGIVNISSVSKYHEFIQATDFAAVTLALENRPN